MWAVPFVSAALLLLPVHWTLADGRRRPPGPYRWPLIGNLFQMTQDRAWLTFAKWSEQYGKLTYLEVFGRPILVLNSIQAAQDLLDKRSAKYSGRSYSVMLNDLMDYEKFLLFQSAGEEWKRQRKVMAYGFSNALLPTYFALQEKQARLLISDLVQQPDQLFPRARRHFGTIIIRAVYGHEVESEMDPILTKGYELLTNLGSDMEPGRWLVDFIPFLRFLPRWLPGMGFLDIAKKHRQVAYDYTWIPYELSKSNNVLLPNLCNTVIDTHGGLEGMTKDDEETLAFAAGNIFGGGLDTNMAALLSFFRFMIIYPEVQRKAQIELDRVVGQDRLPNLRDQASLPYVRGLMSEVLRHCPPAPLGVPHAPTEDDVYDGYFIAKNSLIIANVWQMLRDPTVFPEPTVFNPDRYELLDDEKLTTVLDIVFGFGRRRCPGREFALGSLFAIVSTVLSTCEILPSVDSEGKEVIPGTEMRFEAASLPEHFECRLKYRSEKARMLLEI